MALTIYPVAIAFANAQFEARYMVSVSGGLLLLYSIGNVLTPGIAADLMTRIAPQALFPDAGQRRPARRGCCLFQSAAPLRAGVCRPGASSA